MVRRTHANALRRGAGNLLWRLKGICDCGRLGLNDGIIFYRILELLELGGCQFLSRRYFGGIDLSERLGWLSGSRLINLVE